MKALYGMIHLAPLPGSPSGLLSLDAIEERALRDAAIYSDAGFSGIMVENYGDIPFHGDAVGPETVAQMSRIARALRLSQPGLALGVNVLRNDGEAALAVAEAAGADLIRVNVLSGLSHSDQGPLVGRAAEILRLRRRLDSTLRIFADVDVKHAVMASHADAVHQAEDLAERAGADALVVSGRSTGSLPDRDLLTRLRERFETFPIIIGSGLSHENAAELLALADGAIVGSSLKIGGRTENPVDPARAKALVAAVRNLEE
jgi:uncharacterized protein